jgi:hypothetical protein
MPVFLIYSYFKPPLKCRLNGQTSPRPQHSNRPIYPLILFRIGDLRSGYEVSNVCVERGVLLTTRILGA